LNFQARPGHKLVTPRFLADDNTFAADEIDLDSGSGELVIWSPPSWAQIEEIEAKEKEGPSLKPSTAR